MNPKPHAAKLPANCSLKKYQTLDGNLWEVIEIFTGRAYVTNQPNPKIAVDRALSAIAVLSGAKPK